MAGSRKPKGVKEVPPPGAIVWFGNEQIRPALVPIDSLTEDAENARTHDERSLSAIAASLEEFGQQRPILCDAARMVLAGNGQLIAAHRLGWTHLAAIRSDLKGPKLRAYSLTDNKVALFAGWDETRLLEQLKAIQSEEGPLLVATGFDEAEIDALADRMAQALLESQPADGTQGATPDFEPGDAGDQGRLDEPGETECPECHHVFTPNVRRARG